MWNKAVVMYIRKEDGSVYEKHVFSQAERNKWHMASMLLGFPILKEQVIDVWEDV